MAVGCVAALLIAEAWVEYRECLMWLREEAEEKYRDFSSGLIPGVEPMLGVRIPKLRKQAKQMAAGDFGSMLRSMSAAEAERLEILGRKEYFFEEITLAAMIIGYAKGDLREILHFAKAFVPYIKNWSVNDTFCQTFKLARRYPEEVWEALIAPGLVSHEEYEQRVAAVLMMSHYLQPDWISRVLSALTNMPHEGYYADMGIAWAVATAYAKFPKETRVLIEEETLAPEIHNKAIQKMIESFRVSEEDKKWLRTRKCSVR